MKARLPLASLLALLASAAPAAAGGTQFTPSVSVASANVYCVVQNVGAETTTATARLHDGSGAVVDQNVDYPIYPGVNSPAGDADATGWYYCSFQGLSKVLRGFIAVNESGQTVLLYPAGR